MGDAAGHSRTTSACSWLRRTATTLASTTLLTALVQLPGASAVRAEAAEAANGSGTATLNVDSLTPQLPTQHDTIKVTGTVTNHGNESITDAHIGVEIAPNGPLTNRSEISGTQANGNYAKSSDGSEITGHTVRIPYIPPGISRSFTLDVPVSALGLGGDGVYQLGVSASGQTRSTPYEQVLGITRTFLPWYQQAGGQKIRSTFLWPLIDRPHTETRASADQPQMPLLRDDSLASELAPGGRLQQMVALGKNLPVTWVIDPDLLATVDAMTNTYKVDGPGGDTTHTTLGTGTAYAKEWLNELQQTVQGGEVVALPFGDPDIASIAHHGSSVSGTIAHLKDATDLSTITVQTVLGVTPQTDFSWPSDGQIDPSIVGVATSAGAHNIIARSDSLQETQALSYTPTAARPIGKGATAVVADAALSKTFMGDMTTANNSTLAIQTFLAQSLMINEQAPQQQRSIVIAPQRMPTTSQAQAMAAAITAQKGDGWSQPASLEFAAKATPDPAANRTVPGSGSYPSSLRRQELSTDAFKQIQSVQDSLNKFLVILSRKDRVTIPFGTAELRSMSTQWRGNSDGAAVFRNDVAAYLSDLTQAVRIINKESITLSGRGATIPVTVENSLAQPVTDLQLRLTSSQPNRLEVSDPQTIDVDGGHNRSLKFSTTANANGKAWVTAQLYTQDGTPYGSPMVFQVNVTSITATVMLVIGGGLLLLVLAGVRMYRQRKRVAEQRAAEEGEETDEGDEGDEGEKNDPDQRGECRVPKQSGDPLADTSAESTTPPVAGEKVER
ncbi:MAG: hypothetical protein JO362_03670 [Streptomycetaceae bacterium]|nr:hypothetical protein [Streptomycetaceae bacterium]